MLRCPPTRIGLLPSETASWIPKQKQKNGRPQRQAQVAKRSLRLGYGPRHLAQPGIVLEADNVGRKRAESCSSEATICSELDELHLDSSAGPDDESSSYESTADSSRTTETGEPSHGTSRQQPRHCLEHVPRRPWYRALESGKPITSDHKHMQGYDRSNAEGTFSSLGGEEASLVSPSAKSSLSNDDRLGPVAPPPGAPLCDIETREVNKDSHYPEQQDKHCATPSGRVPCSDDAGKTGTSHFGPPAFFPQRTSSRQHLIEYERSSMVSSTRLQRLAQSEDLIDLFDPNSTDNSKCDLGNINTIHQRRDRTRSHSRTLARNSSGYPQQKSLEVSPQCQRHQQTSCMHEFDPTDESILLRDSPLSELTQCLSHISAERSQSIDELQGNLLDECNTGSPSKPSAQDSEAIRRTNYGHLSHGGPSSTSSYSGRVEASTTQSRDSRRASPSLSPDIPSCMYRGSPKLPTASCKAKMGPSPDSPQHLMPGRVKKGVSNATHTRHDTVVIAPSKVPVFDDSLPPGTQPQNPADTSRLSHWAYQSSGDSLQYGHAAEHTSPADHSSLPTNPRQHAKALPKLPITGDTANPSGPGPSSQQSQGGSDRSRAYGDPRVASEHAENDIWASMQQLEHDRRVRALREGMGDLEITPPREGRFERYFST